MSASANAIFLRAFSAALGESSSNPFSYTNDVPFANLAAAKLPLAPGQRFDYRIGNVDYTFRLVRSAVALAQGDIVKPYIGGTGRTGTLASSTKAISTTASTFVASELAGGIVSLLANTGAPAMRFIRDNSDDAAAGTITVAERDLAHNVDAISTADAWTTTPDATTTFSTYCPWEVDKSSGVTSIPVGVALNTVTAGNFTLICTRGPVLTKVIGSTDAATAMGVVVPSSTAGVAKGPTTAGMTAAEACRVLGYTIDAYAGASALRLVHVAPTSGIFF